MTEKTYSVYKTTNTLNNKIYIGVHKYELVSLDNYLGSGKILWKSIRKNESIYGKLEARKLYKKEVLFDNLSENEAFTIESKLVNKKFIKSLSTYNISLGGKGNSKNLNNPKARIKAWKTRKLNAELKGEHVLKNALNKESIDKRTETLKKNAKSRGGYLGDHLHKPEIVDKAVKTQMDNAKARGGFRGDHMQKPEIRNKANKSISKSMSKIWYEYNLDGDVINEYKGLRSTHKSLNLDVSIWVISDNTDPYRLWIRNEMNFKDELNKRLGSSDIVEIKNDKIIAIFNSNRRKFSRMKGYSAKSYMNKNINNSEFLSVNEYIKRSETKLDA